MKTLTLTDEQAKEILEILEFNAQVARDTVEYTLDKDSPAYNNKRKLGS